jgi:hypothetical protein
MGMDESIVDMLMDHAVDYLAEAMMEEISDDTKVGLLRSGRLQADPTVKKINLTIHQGGVDHPDILVPKDHPLIKYQYEIGGGQFWLRRFRVKFEMFFIGDISRDESRRKANVVASRTRALLQKMPLSGMQDSFTETPIDRHATQLEMREGGGPGAFIWRGDLLWEVVTEIGYA